MLNEIIIPTTIIVHLGPPSEPSENLTIDFKEYLKNVCSSEIYPTWSYECLKANAYAQSSLVLNRIYTQWYPSQGYNFDITNSTSYDQAFVKDRNIFTNISDIIDEIFTYYLILPYHLEPYFAQYCDGRKATCNGMKQWGSEDLANRGLNALEILRYYYGEVITIEKTNQIEAIPNTIPNPSLILGDDDLKVFTIQEFLNGINVNYPNIPLIYPCSTLFDEATLNSVIAFQKTFNLTADGIVGRTTWYQLSYIFCAVRRLAQLTSLGRLQGYFTGLWVGKILRNGDRNMQVSQLQYFLSIIALSNPNIPKVSIDSSFGDNLEASVIAFQNEYGLISDGLVGETTWNTIYKVYTSI